MNKIEMIRSAIRDIPDFPKKGILFKDVFPVVHDGRLTPMVVDLMVSHYKNAAPTKIVGIESRGFLFGMALALRYGIGFVPVRKKGKLPYKTYSASYELEYGSATVEMHQDALTQEDKVIIVDDLLATGGTASAAIELVNKFGSEILGIEFLVELKFLNGRDRLKGYNINTIIEY